MCGYTNTQWHTFARRVMRSSNNERNSTAVILQSRETTCPPCSLIITMYLAYFATWYKGKETQRNGLRERHVWKGRGIKAQPQAECSGAR